LPSDIAARAAATFNVVVEKPVPDREAFLAQACAGDTVLMGEVRALIAAHDAAGGGFMQENSPVSTGIERELARLKPEESGEAIGPYKLREQIGEGGFGSVWVADQELPMRRRVALKIIKMGMDTKEVIARFEQERQALAMMDHPNIAKVLEAGATQYGRPFFVMELVRGVKITDYCDEQKLSTTERVELFITICQAVQHAHQKGIIHRDLKPSNILVTVNDRKPVPKVIDFGVAKATQGRLTDSTVYTQFQQMIGTPLYMSPEQADMTSLDVDTRSDIYSLGVLLYELLTGRTPIDAETIRNAGLDEMRRLIREVDPPRPSLRLKTLAGDDLTTTARRRQTEPAKLPGALRGDLDWIVMKCLEKDRTRRYDTANGLALDLRRHLQNEVITARPPTTAYLLGKLVRRNRLTFVAAAAVTLALVLGIVASMWQAVRARNAEREQRTLRAAAETARAGEAIQRHRAEGNEQAAAKAKTDEEQLRKLAQLHAYAADMKAAQAALQQNSRQQAVTLLEQYWPKPGEPDLRGVEWRYLWQTAKGNEIYTWKHPGMVPGALFSPDGRQIATACFDGMLRIWDIASGKLVTQFDRGVRDDNVRISFCFSPDGNTLASAAREGIVLLDCATWQVKKTLELTKEERDGINSVSLTYSPDGESLAAGFFPNARIWKTRNWESTTLTTYSERRITFSPDSRNLVTNSAGAGINSWDLATGTRLKFADLNNPTWELERFFPAGDRLLSANRTGTLNLWDVRSQQILWSERVHRSRIYGLAASHDGRRFATGGFDQLIHVWDAVTQQKVMTLQGHLNEIWSLELSPDDRYLLTSSKDGTVKLWDAQTKPQSNHWTLDLGEWAVGFTPDGRGLISISSDGKSVRHWSGAQMVKFLPSPDPFQRERTFLSPESQNLYALRPGGEVRIHDANTLKVKRAFQIDNPSCERLYQVSPDERWIAGPCPPSSGLVVWDTASGKSVAHLQDHMEGSGAYDSAVFSPDSRLLAFATETWEVKLWDIEKQQILRTLGPHPWRVNSISFSPNGKYLASSSWEGDVRLFEVATGKEIVAPLYGHGSGVHKHSFSPDGATLVTGGDDDTIRFWNVATGREMLVFNNASSEVSRLPHLSPTGELAVWWDAVQGRARVEFIPTMAEIEKVRRAENIAP
jgi:WD40 repeat protein/serine/threonine protein kinase